MSICLVVLLSLVSYCSASGEFYFALPFDTTSDCIQVAQRHQQGDDDDSIAVKEGNGKMIYHDYELIQVSAVDTNFTARVLQRPAIFQELLTKDGGHFKLCDCKADHDSGEILQCKDIKASVNLVFHMEQIN